MEGRGVSGALGFVGGAAIPWLVWFPADVVAGFIESLMPGAVAHGLGRVPLGYSPGPAFGIAAGIWAALFWIPPTVSLAGVGGPVPMGRGRRDS